jgi:YesN/AraC family two-component response regulator
LQLLQDFLVGIDFAVQTSENGKQALEQISVLVPDLVIIDMDMPVMNGYEAALLIREFWPKIKIIGVSAFSQLDILKNNFIKSCDFFMPKPLDLDLLAEKIQEYFNVEWIFKKEEKSPEDYQIIFPDRAVLEKLSEFVEKGNYDAAEQILTEISTENKKFENFKQKAEAYINDFDDEGLKEFFKNSEKTEHHE